MAFLSSCVALRVPSFAEQGMGSRRWKREENAAWDKGTRSVSGLRAWCTAPQLGGREGEHIGVSLTAHLGALNAGGTPVGCLTANVCCLTLPAFQALGLPLPYIARISGFGSSAALHCPHFRLWVFRRVTLPAFQALGLPLLHIARISGFGSSDALHCPHFRLWVFRCLTLPAFQALGLPMPCAPGTL